MRLDANQKVALFLPINAAGHYQGLLAIANQLRDDYKNVRCVFLVAGPPHGKTIEDHGHELIELDDLAPALCDFDVEPHDQLEGPLSEAEQLARLAAGKERREFRGAERWPQFLARHQNLFRSADKVRLGMAKFVESVIEYCIANCSQIDAAIERLQPDVVVCDALLVQPSVLRNEQTRPWVRLWSPNPLSLVRYKLGPQEERPPAFQTGNTLLTKDKRQELRRERPAAWRAMVNDWARRGREVAQIYKECWHDLAQFYRDNNFEKQLGRSGDNVTCRVDSPYVNFYLFPKALDYDQDDDLFAYPPRWVRCDSLIRKTAGKAEARERERWLKLIEDKKRAQGLDSVVYFSLGSIASGEPSLMQRYVDYLASDTSRRLYIVSKGVNGDQVRLSERNMLGANYLPQMFLLQQSDLAIIHGGNNSLTECLYYGKPIIVLPSFGDQPDNAFRVEDLGLGRRLDLYSCGRDQLLATIDELAADQKLAARARAVGAEMRSHDELGTMAGVVFELLEKGRLSERTEKELNIN